MKSEESIFKTVVENYYGTILVSDRYGNILYVNDNVLKNLDSNQCSMTKDDFLASDIYEVCRKGVFNNSSTVEALQTKKRTMRYIGGAVHSKLLTLSLPVLDEQGEVDCVIAYSASEEFLEQMLLEKSKSMQIAKLLSANKDSALVASSPQMRSILDTLDKVSKLDATVLLTGESGTGKEVLAEYIYKNSHRSDEVFIPVNCASIPAELIESELFGYEKGAFTGANKEGKMGLFAVAHQGTLFLDEVGEMPLSLQSKLLRVLETGEIMPLGAKKCKKVDVRILAATNKDLLQMSSDGTFRIDLYYRLNVLPVHIPPLRERLEDILPLAHLFLERFNKKYALKTTFSQYYLAALERYPWPGNVRELRNVVERFVITATDDLLLTNLPHATKQDGSPVARDDNSINIQAFSSMPYKQAMELFEEKYLREVLASCDNNRTQAAQQMGINRSGLYYILKKHDTVIEK